MLTLIQCIVSSNQTEAINASISLLWMSITQSLCSWSCYWAQFHSGWKLALIELPSPVIVIPNCAPAGAIALHILFALVAGT